MTLPADGPASLSESMRRVQPHLDALAAANGEPVRVTRMRRTGDGWVIAFRSGDGRERAVVVDARDGALRGIEPALAGPASPGAGARPLPLDMPASFKLSLEPHAMNCISGAVDPDLAR